jgi:hypothetical protein
MRKLFASPLPFIICTAISLIVFAIRTAIGK